MDILIPIIIYGSSLGMLYYLLSSGLSLIFGLMQVLNFAHGSLFMWGAYLSYSTYLFTGNFLLSIIIGGLLVAIAGGLMENFLIKPLKGNHTNQILLTFGMIYILDDIVKLIWGTRVLMPKVPDWIGGSINLLGEAVPKYRLFIIAAGLLLFVIVTLILQKSKLGMIIRAGIEKPRMVRALGINVSLIFSVTFMIGCLLAGLGGGVAGPFLSLYPEIGNEQIFNALIVVVVGGIGSFSGSFAAGLIVGLTQYVVGYYIPELSMAVTILIMLIVLIIKPSGMFGGKANAA